MRYESVTFACDNDDCTATRSFSADIPEHVMGMTLSMEGWSRVGNFKPRHLCPEHATAAS